LTRRPPLRAVTLDYWDTLYDGGTLDERYRLRREALGRLLGHYGLDAADGAVDELYRDAGREFERWWREEHRGYTTAERLRWTIARAGGTPKEECAVVDETVRAIDDALLAYPPPLLDGAADAVRRLAERFSLAIISDTGFASGKGQDALLERDGLLAQFPVRVYSCDVGHAKPRPEPFRAALDALGVSPEEALHVGDIERTDVAGALGVGMRAVRIDVARDSGETRAELVVRRYEELMEHLDA
jgi:putative hydrolase of the HAD superfamily